MYISFYVDVSSGATIVLLQALLFGVAFALLAWRRAGRLAAHTHV
jgi:ABC-type Mn2+/Zn2+ transport system permease subunit